MVQKPADIPNPKWIPYTLKKCPRDFSKVSSQRKWGSKCFRSSFFVMEQKQHFLSFCSSPFFVIEIKERQRTWQYRKEFFEIEILAIFYAAKIFTAVWSEWFLSVSIFLLYFFQQRWFLGENKNFFQRTFSSDPYFGEKQSEKGHNCFRPPGSKMAILLYRKGKTFLISKTQKPQFIFQFLFCLHWNFCRKLKLA